jgi:hypothetical protein
MTPSPQKRPLMPRRITDTCGNTHLTGAFSEYEKGWRA